MLPSIIEQYLIPLNRYIYGFADLTGILGPEYAGFSHGISIGRKLDDTIVDQLTDGPTLEYHEHYSLVNRELEEISLKICNDLKNEGIRCEPVIPTLAMSGEEFRPYFAELRYKLSHKMVATRAGLGWIGKTDLFVSGEFGPRLRLVSILIDRPVKALRRPVNRSLCGRCRLCVDACPAHAATGQSWDIHTDRDSFFDPFKCRKTCGELARKKLNSDIHICGICVAVCPVGRKERGLEGKLE